MFVDFFMNSMSVISNNPKTSAAVAVIVAVVIIIISSITIKRAQTNNVPASGFAKTMRTLGYIFLIIVGVILLGSACSGPNNNCLSWLLIFNLFK